MDTIHADASDAIAGLERLEKKLQKTIIRKAVRAMAKPTLTSAKANAPQQSGTLKQSIKLRSGGTKKGVVKIVVGVSTKWFGGSKWYLAFELLGHKIGKMDLGSERTEVAANDCLLKAYEETKGTAVGVFRAAVMDGIDAA